MIMQLLCDTGLSGSIFASASAFTPRRKRLVSQRVHVSPYNRQNSFARSAAQVSRIHVAFLTGIRYINETLYNSTRYYANMKYFSRFKVLYHALDFIPNKFWILVQRRAFFCTTCTFSSPPPRTRRKCCSKDHPAEVCDVGLYTAIIRSKLLRVL